MNFILLSLLLLGSNPAVDNSPQSSARVQVMARATIISGEAVNMNANGFRHVQAGLRDKTSGYSPPLARSHARQERPGKAILIVTEFH
ncbi:hypothetical protein MNBD_ALPHA04-1207 [hydrothermal vent metagenome]|uniref:Uncharacterized protein n=1 Tax=hydrothermal vent metagenome TaxID=652676 RepID=A0A3B0RFX0_9ZZZZ